MALNPNPTPNPLPDYFEETLLAPNAVRLFGRPYVGLSIGKIGGNLDSNDPLVKELNRQDSNKPEPTLARIYGFTYLGSYYKLPAPTVLLVYGSGLPVPSGYAVPALSGAMVGIEQKIFEFMDNIRVWGVDQMDITVRIDVRIGWIRDLLLDNNVGPETNMSSNADLRRSEASSNLDPSLRPSALLSRGVNVVGR